MHEHNQRNLNYNANIFDGVLNEVTKSKQSQKNSTKVKDQSKPLTKTRKTKNSSKKSEETDESFEKEMPQVKKPRKTTVSREKSRTKVEKNVASQTSKVSSVKSGTSLSADSPSELNQLQFNAFNIPSAKTSEYDYSNAGIGKKSYKTKHLCHKFLSKRIFLHIFLFKISFKKRIIEPVLYQFSVKNFLN